jgi:photosystem II stability/assembly factor-like uncharacterized protein
MTLRSSGRPRTTSRTRCRDAGFAERAPRAVAALALAAILSAASARAQQSDDGAEPAEPARLASRSLLLDLATAGGRIVAVGERGHVLLSDDSGASWRQAKSVPTRNLLTGVCFADERHGIAVGHDEIVLATQDGGETWARTHYAPEAQQPLLDVWCARGGRAIAVGAYGAYYASNDGGLTWASRRLDAIPAAGSKPAAAGYEDEIGGDPHLNRIAAASDTRLYVAAEAGNLYRSDDAGTTWHQLPSPYEGSFFGVLPLDGDVVLAFGLRGHLFRSEDAGASWQAVPTGTLSMLNDAARLGSGRVVVVGLAGALLVSEDGGRTFTLRQQGDRKGLSAVVAAGAAEVVTAGEAGVTAMSPAPAVAR